MYNKVYIFTIFKCAVVWHAACHIITLPSPPSLARTSWFCRIETQHPRYLPISSPKAVGRACSPHPHPRARARGPITWQNPGVDEGKCPALLCSGRSCYNKSSGKGTPKEKFCAASDMGRHFGDFPVWKVEWKGWKQRQQDSEETGPTKPGENRWRLDRCRKGIVGMLTRHTYKQDRKNGMFSFQTMVSLVSLG